MQSFPERFQENLCVFRKIVKTFFYLQFGKHAQIELTRVS